VRENLEAVELKPRVPTTEDTIGCTLILHAAQRVLDRFVHYVVVIADLEEPVERPGSCCLNQAAGLLAAQAVTKWAITDPPANLAMRGEQH